MLNFGAVILIQNIDICISCICIALVRHKIYVGYFLQIEKPGKPPVRVIGVI
jgi:hypothetical protein